MNSKYSRRLSSHSQTFQILMQSQDLETLPEFKHMPVQKRKSQLQMKANIFAHILQNLVIPPQKNENDNFIAKIKLNADGKARYHLQILSQHIALSDVSPAIFKHYFSEYKAQNLAAITLFNLICSGRMLPSQLFITQSLRTEHYYFSQGLNDFWADFFDDNNHHVHIASHHAMHDKYMFFIPEEDPWWANAISNHSISNLKQIFIDEFFKVYLRLSLTPMALLEKIMAKLFALENKSEVERFIQYLKDRMSWFFRNFDSFLSLREKAGLKHFINEQGNEELDKYLQDVDTYFNEVPFVSPEELANMHFEILSLAMNLGIPNLDHLCTVPVFKDYSNMVKMSGLRYILSRIEIEQASVLIDPTHRYWHILEDISSELKRYPNSVGGINIGLINIYIFIKAIQYHKHHFALFLLTKNNLFKNVCIRECGDFDPDKDNLEGRNPLTIALLAKNSVIFRALHSRGADISKPDRLFIKDALKKAVISSDQTLFAFIIQNCPQIIDHQQFNEELLALCHANAPELLPHLLVPPPLVTPRPNRLRRLSFTFEQKLKPIDEPVRMDNVDINASHESARQPSNDGINKR